MRRSSTPSPACSGVGSMRAIAATLLLPELLPDEEDWRVDTPLRLSTHRPLIGGVLLFVKTRVLLPLNRWLYRYTREHFRRQHQVNLALFACLESLAIENARLRQDVDALRGTARASPPGAPRPPSMKLACVVHRYGTDVTGGSEAHCRSIAERLAERHDVTVLTTCAKNYVTWRNAYPAGETTVNGVRVHRFRVERSQPSARVSRHQRPGVHGRRVARGAGALVRRKRSLRARPDRSRANARAGVRPDPVLVVPLLPGLPRRAGRARARGARADRRGGSADPRADSLVVLRAAAGVISS